MQATEGATEPAQSGVCRALSWLSMRLDQQPPGSSPSCRSRPAWNGMAAAGHVPQQPSSSTRAAGCTPSSTRPCRASRWWSCIPRWRTAWRAACPMCCRPRRWLRRPQLAGRAPVRATGTPGLLARMLGWRSAPGSGHSRRSRRSGERRARGMRRRPAWPCSTASQPRSRGWRAWTWATSSSSRYCIKQVLHNTHPAAAGTGLPCPPSPPVEASRRPVPPGLHSHARRSEPGRAPPGPGRRWRTACS